MEAEKPGLVQRLKERWGIHSTWQIIIICIVFAITGSLSVKVGAPVLGFLGIEESMPGWIYWPLRILVIFPVYQVLLILIGSLFGQFRFFWNVEQKMLSRMGLGFLFRKK